MSKLSNDLSSFGYLVVALFTSIGVLLGGLASYKKTRRQDNQSTDITSTGAKVIQEQVGGTDDDTVTSDVVSYFNKPSSPTGWKKILEAARKQKKIFAELYMETTIDILDDHYGENRIIHYKRKLLNISGKSQSKTTIMYFPDDPNDKEATYRYVTTGDKHNRPGKIDQENPQPDKQKIVTNYSFDTPLGDGEETTIEYDLEARNTKDYHVEAVTTPTSPVRELVFTVVFPRGVSHSIVNRTTWKTGGARVGHPDETSTCEKITRPKWSRSNRYTAVFYDIPLDTKQAPGIIWGDGSNESTKH